MINFKRCDVMNKLNPETREWLQKSAGILNEMDESNDKELKNCEQNLKYQKQRFNNFVDECRQALGPFDKRAAVVSHIASARMAAQTHKHTSYQLANALKDIMAAESFSEWRKNISDSDYNEIKNRVERSAEDYRIK